MHLMKCSLSTVVLHNVHWSFQNLFVADWSNSDVETLNVAGRADHVEKLEGFRLAFVRVKKTVMRIGARVLSNWSDVAAPRHVYR